MTFWVLVGGRNSWVASTSWGLIVFWEWDCHFVGLHTGEMREIVQNFIFRLPWQRSIMHQLFPHFRASAMISVLVLLKCHVPSMMGIGRVRDIWVGIWIGFSWCLWKSPRRGDWNPLRPAVLPGASREQPLSAVAGNGDGLAPRALHRNPYEHSF